jgi:hypothetical protein
MQPTPNPEMSWPDMSRLGGVEVPRVASWASLPAGTTARRLQGRNLAILGQDWWLRRPQWVAALLDTLQGEFDLDRDAWRAQRPFLHEFIGGFFHQGDNPAWVTIHAHREGFSRQMQKTQVANFLHWGSLDALQIPLECVARSGSTLSGAPLPRLPFRAFHSLDVSRDRLNMQRLWIHRALQPGVDGRVLTSTEERLVFVYDAEDLSIARKGVTPALERFRDANDVHSSPIVSLCRLDERGQVAHRCFSIYPSTGELADFRGVAYDWEYYVRCNPTTRAMLTAVTTPGRYEPY